MTVETILPANVHALIVGIEQYKAGPRYDLNGPANDALKFLNWLLKKGVKAETIKIFLSPLDQNEDVIAIAEDKGISPRRATRDNISKGITDLKEQGGRDKLLYVFWAGHGFITKVDGTTRRLFFADTDTKNKWNLDFDSLLQAFQTGTRGTVFSQQIFFIDACANPIFRDFYPTLEAVAGGEKFSTSGEQGKSQQFALFASAEYQVAINESGAGTGRFSNAVLEVMKEQSLLPDMDEVSKQIKENFREKQHLEPVFWSFSIGGKDQDVTDNVNKKINEYATPTPLSLSQSQQLKLQFLQTKRDDLNKKLQKVQAEIGAVDFLEKERLENRLDILFGEIEKVNQDIQKLEQGNG